MSTGPDVENHEYIVKNANRPYAPSMPAHRAPSPPVFTHPVNVRYVPRRSRHIVGAKSFLIFGKLQASRGVRASFPRETYTSFDGHSVFTFHRKQRRPGKPVTGTPTCGPPCGRRCLTPALAGGPHRRGPHCSRRCPDPVVSAGAPISGNPIPGRAFLRRKAGLHLQCKRSSEQAPGRISPS